MPFLLQFVWCGHGCPRDLPRFADARRSCRSDWRGEFILREAMLWVSRTADCSLSRRSDDKSFIGWHHSRWEFAPRNYAGRMLLDGGRQKLSPSGFRDLFLVRFREPKCPRHVCHHSYMYDRVSRR